MLAIVKIRFANYIDIGFFLNKTRREMAAMAFELEFELFLIRKFASDANLKIEKKNLFIKNKLTEDLGSAPDPTKWTDPTPNIGGRCRP